MNDLGFHIDDNAILRWDDNGCCIASDAEKRLWDELHSVTAENALLKENIMSAQNDGYDIAKRDMNDQLESASAENERQKSINTTLLKEHQRLVAENERYREALKLIAECELGYEGMEARKVLGLPEPGKPTIGSNQESWERVSTEQTCTQNGNKDVCYECHCDLYPWKRAPDSDNAVCTNCGTEFGYEPV